MEWRVRMAVAGHVVQCPVSKQRVPGEKCKNSLSIRQYFPRTLPQPPGTCESGTSVTDFLGGGVVAFNSMKLIYQTNFSEYTQTSGSQTLPWHQVPLQTCCVKEGLG